MGPRKLLTLLALTVAAFATASPAHAAPASVFDGKIPCAEREGVMTCEGAADKLVLSFDGAPLDVNVTFPKGEGPWPLIGIYHGWGGSKLSFSAAKPLAQRGYAVFTMSDRGWGQSCGGTSQQRFTPACAEGYNHLMDTRYEVRDAQELIGRLADEGIADPRRIGASGGSYGGGISMALAALRNRIMLPDGSYAPWRSPSGKQMQIAAAAPEIPWTDLAYSLTPTGRTLDYVSDNPYGERGGIMKQSFVSGLFATGLATSNYAAPGTDEDADLFKWYALTSAGEPYDDNPQLMDTVDELTTHHSSYYIDDSVTPAPMLINNGFTDDLFPVDEALRFYNRTRDRHKRARVALYFMDNGHQRGQNKAADAARLDAAQAEWFDYYLKGAGSEPFQGVRVLTIACGEPSEGPYAAKTWRAMSPGEVRLTDATAKTIVSGGDPRVSQAFDPITGGGACATSDGADQAGTATYRLPAVGEQQYTVLGSPTVIADIAAPSPHAQIAARLLDVGPDGQQTLVARGLYRPDATGRQVFQLHPTAWRFKSGHTPKLELLASDAPYGRVSNGGGPVTVSNLELRLPTADRPGGVVSAPAPKLVPPGKKLAGDYIDKPDKPRGKHKSKGKGSDKGDDGDKKGKRGKGKRRKKR
jgi:predicted acyl esterase